MSALGSGAGLFDAGFLARLERLQILFRKLARGREVAERRARGVGSSMEFADYRNYVPGDDPRRIDWGAYGRLDRLFLKLYEEERDAGVHLLVDASRSMRWTPGPGAVSKFDLARLVAASVAYLSLARLDRAGVRFFDRALDEGTGLLRGRRSFHRVLDYLEHRVPEGGGTDLGGAVAEFSRRIRRRGMAVVLSDFLDPSGIFDPLRELRATGFEVDLVHVVDPAEREPLVPGEYLLEDAETGVAVEVSLDPRRVSGYRSAFDARVEELRRFARQQRIRYVLAETGWPFEDVVLRRLRESGLVR